MYSVKVELRVISRVRISSSCGVRCCCVVVGCGYDEGGMVFFLGKVFGMVVCVLCSCELVCGG